MLYHGKGVEVDKGKAVYYYKMSAERGNTTVMRLYALALYDGDVI